MRSSGKRGFTILEALVAIVVLIGIMLAMVGLVPTTFQTASRDSQRIQAVTAAQQYLDALRYYVKTNGVNTGMPSPTAVTIDEGDQFMGSGNPMPSSSPGTFTLTNNGCPSVVGSNRMFDCVVYVAWTEAGENRTSQVESYVTAEN